MHDYNHQTMVRRVNEPDHFLNGYNSGSIGWSTQTTSNYTKHVKEDEWIKVINRINELEAEVLKLKTGEIKIQVEKFEL